jgi:hypothetical protein
MVGNSTRRGGMEQTMYEMVQLVKAYSLIAGKVVWIKLSWKEWA